MGIERGHRFDVDFNEAFPMGLVLNGEVEPDYEFQQDRNAPKRIKVDPVTGKHQYKAIFSDPAHTKESEASVKVIFLSDYQPVPNTDEFVPGCGMRPAVLDGLQVTPRVAGQGEFKKLSWTYFATDFAGSSSAQANATPPKTTSNGESGRAASGGSGGKASGSGDSASGESGSSGSSKAA